MDPDRCEPFAAQPTSENPAHKSIPLTPISVASGEYNIELINLDDPDSVMIAENVDPHHQKVLKPGSST